MAKDSETQPLIKVTPPIFEVNNEGKVTRCHGKDLPEGLINIGTGVPTGKLSSAHEAALVMKGAYAFAKRLTGAS